MAQIRPAQDPFGLSRLTEQITLNRATERQGIIDEQNAITQGLQQQLLGGQVQAQQGQLADFAAQRQQKQDLANVIGEDTGESNTLKTIRFFGERDPEKAQGLVNSAFELAGNISKFNAQGGVDFINKELGLDWKLEEETPETFQVNQGDKISIIDKKTNKVLETFPVTQKPKQLTPQQEAFSRLSPADQAATFFKSGQTVELGPDGVFKITQGGATKSVQQQKLETKEKELKIKADKRRNQAISKTDIVLTKVDEASGLIGLTTAGLGGAVTGVVPGTPARDLQGSIDTIKANLAFQALQDMREASPTGGALGAVSERELNLLESTITSLDTKQSPERLRQNLDQIKELFNNAKRNLEVAESFRRQGLDPDNLTEEQIQTQIQTDVEIVVPNHPEHGDVTREDIERTMQDTGLSEDEVLKALGAI